MDKKCLVFFVEGETEVAFYKQLLSVIKKKNGCRPFHCAVEIKNVQGVGRYKVLRYVSLSRTSNQNIPITK